MHVKWLRGVVAGLAAAVILLGLGVAQAAPQTVYPPLHSTRAQHTGPAHQQRHTHHHGISWHEHDRTVYVVSTLNAPLCDNGQQLSSVLWKTYDARIFDVSRSVTIRRLYFIQVRTAAHELIGVYAYKFGWKLPTGVENGKCVTTAASDVLSDYQAHSWRFEIQFSSTYPQN